MSMKEVAVPLPHDYKDVTTLSFFPQPGMSNRAYGLNMFSNIVRPNDENYDEDDSKSLANINPERDKFWIPDEKCKYCRGCGLPFTTFLR
jgi:hypothetical protein